MTFLGKESVDRRSTTFT